tara:strand:+ start:29062 stop:29307 length:246 start_codon:yes stop_codon:yes gene_type:complete
MFGLFSTPKKKKLKYKVVVKGVTISKHSKVTLARLKARSIGSAARVVPISKTKKYKVKTYKRKTLPRRRKTSYKKRRRSRY